ncbi:unnamed protein product [Kuraishia capsulata CBS 1993]|uniref:Required for respiratory growth protein 9, mitochondrial n=1 Tax=Kuraishia capsulata CBS 1993 TaxID=1382522 RepID=W6MQY4_9ASCO|nr:uncharacterized protein KUCA_T00005083001 [Kuraishia capsulata CBS 1993]CDK29096.1 unnamed protein product [Kuraishia capsulata CBS 1993]
MKSRIPSLSGLRSLSSCRMNFGRSGRPKTWDLPRLSESTTPTAKKEVSGVPKDWRSRSNLDSWQRQKYAIKEKLNAQPWRPITKLPRAAIEEIKDTKRQYPGLKPDHFAELYGVSPESIRRILKSNWTPTVELVEEKEMKYNVNRKPYETRDKLAVRIANNYLNAKEKELGVEIPDSDKELIKSELLQQIKTNSSLLRHLQEFK